MKPIYASLREGESATACLAMEMLREKYPDGVVPENVLQAQRDIRYKTKMESVIIVHVANFLGLDVHGLRGQRTLKELRIRGDQPLVEIALELIEHHMKALGPLVDEFVAGYLMESMPYEMAEENEAEPAAEPVAEPESFEEYMASVRLRGGRR